VSELKSDSILWILNNSKPKNENDAVYWEMVRQVANSQLSDLVNLKQNILKVVCAVKK